MQAFERRTREFLPDMIELRRALHRRPEVGLILPETQQRLLAALRDLPLTTRLGERVSSVVATLEGARPGPTVLLRADMDALPMQEENEVSFRSERDGQAHACGHDAHMAMLAFAARVLCEARERLAGRVLFVFQPGEEALHGAQIMLEEGLLDPKRAGEVKYAFAVHQFPTLPAGTVATRAGALMAAMDGFRIIVRGRGGHASAPADTIDPVPIACEIVTALQTFMARRVPSFDPAVVTVAKIQAGSALGVIPDCAVLEGMARSVSEATRARVLEGLRSIATHVAAAYGASAEVQLGVGGLPSIPVTVNDPDAVARLQRTAAELFGAERVLTMPNPVMASEDFAFILQHVPGAMAFVGTRPDPNQPAQPLHSSRMMLDERELATGALLHVAIALSVLQAPS